MLILIVALLIMLIVLFAQFGSTYHTQVKVMRRFFKNKGVAPEDYRARTGRINDIDYQSVFPHGQLDLYTANDAANPQPIVVWVHGGGYVGGDKTCIESWAYILAAELKAAIASINYCPAPEQHYPGPLIQLSEALRFLTDNSARFGLDPERIFIGGDSAGAQIASQYAALVCSEPYRNTVKIHPPIAKSQLKGVLLCCGFYNMDTVIKSHFPAIKTFMWAYTNQKKLAKFDRKDEMSVIRHIDADYCDVFITCGNADPFIGQAREMTEALTAADICTDAYLPQPVGKKLGHEYQFMVGTTEANAALKKAMDFIAQRI